MRTPRVKEGIQRQKSLKIWHRNRCLSARRASWLGIGQCWRATRAPSQRPRCGSAVRRTSRFPLGRIHLGTKPQTPGSGAEPRQEICFRFTFLRGRPSSLCAPDCGLQSDESPIRQNFSWSILSSRVSHSQKRPFPGENTRRAYPLLDEVTRADASALTKSPGRVGRVMRARNHLRCQSSLRER